MRLLGGRTPWKFVDKMVVCIAADILVEVHRRSFWSIPKFPNVFWLTDKKKHRTWPQISKLAGWLIIIFLLANKETLFCLQWWKKNCWFEIFMCPTTHSRGHYIPNPNNDNNVNVSRQIPQNDYPPGNDHISLSKALCGDLLSRWLDPNFPGMVWYGPLPWLIPAMIAAFLPPSRSKKNGTSRHSLELLLAQVIHSFTQQGCSEHFFRHKKKKLWKNWVEDKLSRKVLQNNKSLPNKTRETREFQKAPK